MTLVPPSCIFNFVRIFFFMPKYFICLGKTQSSFFNKHFLKSYASLSPFTLSSPNSNHNILHDAMIQLIHYEKGHTEIICC